MGLVLKQVHAISTASQEEGELTEDAREALFSLPFPCRVRPSHLLSYFPHWEEVAKMEGKECPKFRRSQGKNEEKERSGNCG